MSFRTKRRKKTGKLSLPTGFFVKVRLTPWVRTQNGCVWLASMAASRSNRQVNDWLNRRKNHRVRRMDMNLTGKHGNQLQALAVRFTRQMEILIPQGDSVFFICESAKPDKQFRVWKKWFLKHENNQWEFDEKNKGFFFYRSKDLE